MKHHTESRPFTRNKRKKVWFWLSYLLDYHHVALGCVVPLKHTKGVHQVNPKNPMQSNRHQKWIYLRLLSYMLLDWAQILKGSGFLWMVPSPVESWAGRLGKGWEGGGGAMLSLRGGARDGCPGESVWTLRWLETLCCELFWLSFLDNCCWRSTVSFHN